MSAPSFTIPKAPLTPAGDYRVPAGYFAVTIDFFPPPLAPSTVTIEAVTGLKS
jgi:hypothetical protein